jgi:hypothetical protein
MILNGRQQRQLWEMANGNTSTSNPEIKLRISGSDLVGVMSNVNSRYNKIR